MSIAMMNLMIAGPRWLLKSVGILSLTLFFAWPNVASAKYRWQCEGDPLIVHKFAVESDLAADSTGNAAGTLIEEESHSGQSGRGKCDCWEDGQYYSFFTATTDLPDAGNGWRMLNDYIEVKTFIFIYGPGFQEVPFDSVQNAGLSTCYKRDSLVSGVATGSQIKTQFRLRKGIIAQVLFSGRLATLYWRLAPDPGSVDYAYPFAYVDANIQLNADTSCSFRQGDTFTVELGKIGKYALKTGEPPLSPPPARLDLGVDCVNMQSNQVIDYTFQSASGSEGNLIKTTLPGVGIGLLDDNHNPIGLGFENSVSVPSTNASTHFFVNLYPARLPGQAIEVGQFSAQAIVTMTLP
ncbi:fimbrial protein [Aeromonas sp. NJAU223]|uniref:fimbrial protein n=1 Tax=Aeromonas sp. NJAU223 TaxID=3115650 RepID=UPI003DA923F5